MARKKKSKNVYWAQPQEEAIVAYLSTDSDKEKNELFIDVIQPAFRKLIENIYFTFNFNKVLNDFDQIEHDLLIHLCEKIYKFNPDRNKKSFSFFGTITKNWLIQKSNAKKRIRYVDNENREGLITDISMRYDTQLNYQQNLVEFLIILPDLLNDESFTRTLSDDDLNILQIVSEIIRNYQKFDISNKKQLYLYVREATDLPSRKITKSLAKIKNRYYELKNIYL